MAHGGGRRTDTASGVRSREEFLLAFGGFCLLFGQPVVVFALATGTPGLGSLAVIASGTVVLAAMTARVFVRQQRSVGRLGDFIIALAAVQLALAAVLLVLLRVVEPRSVTVAATRVAAVLAAYPLAYYAVYRGVPVSVLDLGRQRR